MSSRPPINSGNGAQGTGDTSAPRAMASAVSSSPAIPPPLFPCVNGNLAAPMPPLMNAPQAVMGQMLHRAPGGPSMLLHPVLNAPIPRMMPPVGLMQPVSYAPPPNMPRTARGIPNSSVGSSGRPSSSSQISSGLSNEGMKFSHQSIVHAAKAAAARVQTSASAHDAITAALGSMPGALARNENSGTEAANAHSSTVGSNSFITANDELRLLRFWDQQLKEHLQLPLCSLNKFKTHSDLPLARIKRIMKADEDVRMVSAEAPIVFARACRIFILELTLRSWFEAEEAKRKTLQKEDIHAAILKTDIFDFLVDVVDGTIEEEQRQIRSASEKAAKQAAERAAGAKKEEKEATENAMWKDDL